MNSALQPQLLKLEGVFDETVKSSTTTQEELKSAIVLRCVGGQLKSYLSLTIGATSMVYRLSRAYATLEVVRVQAAKRKGKKGKNDHQKGKGTDTKGKGKKGKGKDQKGKGAATSWTSC